MSALEKLIAFQKTMGGLYREIADDATLELDQLLDDLAQAYKVLSEAGLFLNAERFEKYEMKEKDYEMVN